MMKARRSRASRPARGPAITATREPVFPPSPASSLVWILSAGPIPELVEVSPKSLSAVASGSRNSVVVETTAGVVETTAGVVETTAGVVTAISKSTNTKHVE